MHGVLRTGASFRDAWVEAFRKKKVTMLLVRSSDYFDPMEDLMDLQRLADGKSRVGGPWAFGRRATARVWNSRIIYSMAAGR
jgi:hypothetical protein